MVTFGIGDGAGDDQRQADLDAHQKHRRGDIAFGDAARQAAQEDVGEAERQQLQQQRDDAPDQQVQQAEGVREAGAQRNGETDDDAAKRQRGGRVAGADQRQFLVRRHQHVDDERGDEEAERHAQLNDEIRKPRHEGVYGARKNP